MKAWEQERAQQYPNLWRLAKVLTDARCLTADESKLLQCLEEKTQELPVQRLMAPHKKPRLAPKKLPSRQRAKKIRTRIKVGLTYWIGECRGQSIRTVCQTYKLVALNTYYTYQQEGLAYTEADLRPLGVTWPELWVALQQDKTVLEARIDTLLLAKTWRG